MKNWKTGFCLAAAALLLTACGSAPAASSLSPSAASSSAGSQSVQSEAAAKEVRPLPGTLDVNALTDCTFAAAFTPKDVFLNDDGALVVHLTVYDYELFDLVDISSLKQGDTIVADGNNVVIDSIEENEYGLLSINGGQENGGFDLATNDDGVYYEIGMDDIKSYYTLGEATLPVSQDFKLIDNSDLDHPDKETLPGDFLTEMSAEDAQGDFTPYNTTVVVQDGKIISITKNFVP